MKNALSLLSLVFLAFCMFACTPAEPPEDQQQEIAQVDVSDFYQTQDFSTVKLDPDSDMGPRVDRPRVRCSYVYQVTEAKPQLTQLAPVIPVPGTPGGGRAVVAYPDPVDQEVIIPGRPGTASEILARVKPPAGAQYLGYTFLNPKIRFIKRINCRKLPPPDEELDPDLDDPAEKD